MSSVAALSAIRRRCTNKHGGHNRSVTDFSSEGTMMLRKMIGGRSLCWAERHLELCLRIPCLLVGLCLRLLDLRLRLQMVGSTSAIVAPWQLQHLRTTSKLTAIAAASHSCDSHRCEAERMNPWLATYVVLEVNGGMLGRMAGLLNLVARILCAVKPSESGYVRQKGVLRWQLFVTRRQSVSDVTTCEQHLAPNAVDTCRAVPLETESTTSRVLSDAHELVSFALFPTAPAASCAARLASLACMHMQPE